MKLLKTFLVIVAVLVVAGAAFVYSGAFNVAADDPHWGITARLMESARDRSIAARARDIEAPPALDDPALLAMGAEHYAAMCTNCHLAPGMADTETRKGLYPKPPNLAEHADHRSPGEVFWIIKHGVKMTGMPAWGLTHDDASIWGMVAFLKKLPELSPGEYEALAGEARAAGHGHGGDEGAHSHDEAPAPESAPEPDESKPHTHDSDAEHAH